MINWDMQRKLIERRAEIIDKIKQIIVDELSIDIDPVLIENDQPLMGRGLGLDSIDALELSISVSTEFDVEVDERKTEIFGSINKMTDYIIEQLDNEQDTEVN